MCRLKQLDHNLVKPMCVIRPFLTIGVGIEKKAKKNGLGQQKWTNGILLPKLLWHSVRKNCSRDQEKLLKFEAEGQVSSKILRSLDQFIQKMKGQNNFC